MTKILIIGKGYIGSYLNGHLLRHNWYVDTVCKNTNISKQLINTYDAIIYLGVGSRRIKNNMSDFKYLLSILEENQKLIYASSSCVYGTNFNCTEESPLETTTHYDASKALMDKWVLEELASSKKQIYGLRLGTVNGVSPKMRNDLMLNSMVNEINQNQKYYISSPDTQRPLLGINDLGRGIQEILDDKESRYGIYNMASFQTCVSDLSVVVNKVTGIDAIPMGNMVNSTYNFSINCEKFCKAFSFSFEDTAHSLVSSMYITRPSSSVSEINYCRVCRNEDLSIVLYMGDVPLANMFQKELSVLPTYPLQLMVCYKCFHLQLSHVVNPQLLYKNYLYTSGTSETTHKYFTWIEEFSKSLIKQLYPEKLLKPLTVLEIACNDGTQLRKFKNKGWRTIGVDPAQNLNNPSGSRGDTIYCDFWNSYCAVDIEETIDLVLAQNVFAHTDDVHDFLRSCKLVMSDSTLLLIQTSQANMIQKQQCDTIYHEHLSFFSITSMTTLLKLHNLYLYKTFVTDIHGDSLLFVVGKKSISPTFIIYTSNYIIASKTIADEEEEGILLPLTYDNYSKTCLKNAYILREEIHTAANKHRLIIGYGASAKGNTILSACLTEDETKLISFIIDENTLKQDRFTPGTGVVIKCPFILEGLHKDIPLSILMLSWNFEKEIKAKITKYGFTDIQYIYPTKK